MGVNPRLLVVVADTVSREYMYMMLLSLLSQGLCAVMWVAKKEKFFP
jgi:hypothetical protein